MATKHSGRNGSYASQQNGRETTNALAHFEGSFTADERRRISQAVSEAELTMDEKAPPPRIGKPWIITVVEGVHAGRVLLAHRIGTKRPLTATSVDNLIVQLTSPR